MRAFNACIPFQKPAMGFEDKVGVGKFVLLEKSNMLSEIHIWG